MVINPYFREKYEYEPTQDLVYDLIDEIIQIHGIDIYYVPRTFKNLDYLFGEDRDAIFENAYQLEIYPDKFEGFGGENDFVSKFGIEIRDSMDFTVSQRRWQNVVGTPENADRPKEGDLIYFPLSRHLFQINFVEHEQPFYQLGKRFLYQLKCTLITYSHEQFNTKEEVIDDTQTEYFNADDVTNDPFANNDEYEVESLENKTPNESNIFGDY